MALNLSNLNAFRPAELLLPQEAGQAAPALDADAAGSAQAILEPNEPDGFEAVAQSRLARQGASGLRDTSPAGVAQGAVAQEQARAEGEKYSFDPEMTKHLAKFNQDRFSANAKTGEKINDLDFKISQELEKSGGKENGKVKDLEKKRDKLEKELKPEIDPAQFTAEIDGVMNQPGLSGDDKKKQLEEIRNHYGLSKHKGDVSMNTFTQHLSKVDGDSKGRLEKLQKAQDKQLDAQLDSVKKTFGKNSPEFKALEAQKKAVDNNVFKPEIDRLGDQAKTLHNAYRPKSFWEKVGNFFKGIGKGIVNFGKGLFNGVVNLGKGLFKTFTDIPKGLFNGVKKLFHGDIGGAFKSVGQGFVNAAKDGFKTVKDGLPTLATIASFVPGLDAVAIPLRAALAVKDGVEGFKNGDVLGGLAGLAGGVAGGAGAAGFRNVAKAAGAVEQGAIVGQGAQALASGDVVGGVGAIAGGFAGGTGRASRTAGQVATGAQLVQTAQSTMNPETLNDDSFGTAAPPSWL